MTNREKYAKQILDIVCEGHQIAIRKCDNKLIACSKLSCAECAFQGKSCESNIREWCHAEYEAPPIDWGQVVVDTPILVRDFTDDPWTHAHFAKYEAGVVYAWTNGSTSWTQSSMSKWKYAKLAESEVRG